MISEKRSNRQKTDMDVHNEYAYLHYFLKKYITLTKKLDQQNTSAPNKVNMMQPYTSILRTQAYFKCISITEIFYTLHWFP